MKKTKYISKYDFINYYAKPKSLWFFNNAEIEAAINLEFKNLNLKIDDVDDEKEIEEIDAFEIYQEILSQNQNVDLNNPLLIEGNIIDQNSRKYLKKIYDKSYEVIDLDVDYKNKTNEEKAKICLDLIFQKKKLILFQPVFISQLNSSDVITIPDCIVIDKNNFKLYETKGTSSTKKHHLLDIYFQAQVIESIEILKNKFEFNYFLCIVAYVKAKKNQCPLIETPYCNIGKSAVLDEKKLREEGFFEEKITEFMQSFKIGEWTSKSVNYEFFPFSISNFVKQDLNELDQRIAENAAPQSVKACEVFQKDALKMFESFLDIIKELSDYKKKLSDKSIPIIDKPGYGDKSEWKDCDFFALTKQIYAAKGYEILKYSGNVMNQSLASLKSYHPGDDLIHFFKSKKNLQKLKKIFLDNFDVTIPKTNVLNFLKEMKAKKVYFDFETINTAIRPYDNIFPFRQIVTQSSVIVDNGKNQKFEAQNLIIDPLKIDNKWFKEIVDSLYKGKEYSYIVYNKAFEKSRLNEIKIYLNNNEYSSKIEIIINNMIDLAELFDIRKKHGIAFKKLGGFYSIKKVLPLVSEYDPKIFEAVHCLDYKELKIANGKSCQDKTAARFFKIIDEKNWDEISNDLKIYCENDVRAMIAVEYFINNLIKGVYEKIKINFL